MNLGVYLPVLEKNVVKAIVNEIKQGFESKKLKDASIFYDDVGPIENQNVCGMFNATDLWKFTGTLVTFSSDTLAKSRAASNKFRTVYCHGLVQYDVLSLLKELNAKHYLAMNKESEADFVRVTGKPVGRVLNGFQGLVQALGDLR